jgi:hypothetical protein
MPADLITPASTPRAVFLSHAPEDTDATPRIAEALRSQSVEVWFDQNELQGGDAWAAKIRRPIKECALFMPVISAHTQDPHEGHFRLGWKLAVECTHRKVAGSLYLAPVAIDDPPDAPDMVPDEFLQVRWT